MPNATASTPSKRGATQALPSTHARPLESAPFLCSNLRGLSPHPKTGQRGPGDLRGIHPPYRLVAHRRLAADTPYGAPGSSSGEPMLAPARPSRVSDLAAATAADHLLKSCGQAGERSSPDPGDSPTCSRD